MICCFSDIMFRYIKIELVTGDDILKVRIRFWFRDSGYFPSNDLKKKVECLDLHFGLYKKYLTAKYTVV